MTYEQRLHSLLIKAKKALPDQDINKDTKFRNASLESIAKGSGATQRMLNWFDSVIAKNVSKKGICYAKILCQFDALHYWEDAPQEVYYLKNLHRHTFGVILYIEQKHNDREVEYYILKDWLQNQLHQMDKPIKFSCEQYAYKIYELINKQYPNRKMKIEVNEDHQQGAFYDFS